MGYPNPGKNVIRRSRMPFIHEFTKILPLDFFPRISENLAESIVEVDKIAVDICFVNSVTDFFYEDLAAFIRQRQI